MKKEQSFEARVQLTARMHQGQSWQAAAAATGLHVSQSTAYRCQQPSQEPAAGEKKTGEGSAFPQPEWQEGAGSLLLLAAAQQTELLPRRESALSPNLLTTAPSLRLAHSQPETLQKQLLTLLFLQGVGLRRTWDETKLHRSGSGLTHRSPPRLWLSPHRAVFSGVSSRGSR